MLGAEKTTLDKTNPGTKRVFTSSAPWVVGREALLEYAVEEFLHEMTRQKPWLRARYEAFLGDFSAKLEAKLGYPAPLAALTHKRAHLWLRAQAKGQRPLAEGALNGFADYLVKWGWLEAHPLRQPQAV